jgi:MFS family permease
MEGLDATIIATSLPQIAHAMNVPATTIGVTLTAYLISVSMWMAASGWLADRFEQGECSSLPSWCLPLARPFAASAPTWPSL